MLADILDPGRKVSIDLYQSPVPSRLPNTFGRESKDGKYAGGAIFLDLATKLVFVNHQVNLTAAHTVRSKHLFESFAGRGKGTTLGPTILDQNLIL